MPRFLGPTQGMPGMFDYQMPDGSVTPLPINPQQAQALTSAPTPDAALRPPMAPQPPAATPAAPPGPGAQQIVPQVDVPQQPQGASPVPSGLTQMFQDQVNARRQRAASIEQALGGLGQGLGQVGAQLSSSTAGTSPGGGLFELLRQQQFGRGF